MSIWTQQPNLVEINKRLEKTAAESLGIRITSVSDNTLTGEMPVDTRTRQPFGILHGGASVLFAETLGGVASSLCVTKGTGLVGLEINANHLGAAKDGVVEGVASAIHIGRSTQVWDIRIHHKATGKAVCVSRLTVAVLAS